MATVRIQGERERQKHIYYEYDPGDLPLGEGGMGKVYKGWRVNELSNQRREVAIKFLYSDLPQHVIARARREASVRLKNDNLIEMIDFVETVDRDELGQPVVHYHVISEYLHGVTLDKLLNGQVSDHRGLVIPFAQELYGKFINNSYSFAITVVRSLLSGLMALHDAGYIHRDIDPSNIMVTSRGKIKLIDYGIAKRIDGNGTKESSYTVAGQFIGKPKYAAPELVRGLVDMQTFSTDLYAVGILLYQLLTGKVPFDGEMAEVLEMQLSNKIPLQNVKQKQIREVIRTATQKKRQDRYQSAAEFRVAVDKLVPLPYPGKAVNWKMIGVVAGGAAACAGILLGIAALISHNRQTPAAAPDMTPATAEVVAVPDSAIARAEEKPAAAPAPAQSYGQAATLLADKATAPEGLAMLRTLSDNGDYRSTYLLSRLYYQQPDRTLEGAFADTVSTFAANAAIPRDVVKAHALLVKAVKLESGDYHSQYELACDYRTNNRRRGADQNLDSAYIHMSKAKELAGKSGDSRYLKAIDHNMYGLAPKKAR